MSFLKNCVLFVACVTLISLRPMCSPEEEQSISFFKAFCNGKMSLKNQNSIEFPHYHNESFATPKVYSYSFKEMEQQFADRLEEDINMPHLRTLGEYNFFWAFLCNEDFSKTLQEVQEESIVQACKKIARNKNSDPITIYRDTRKEVKKNRKVLIDALDSKDLIKVAAAIKKPVQIMQLLTEN